MAKTEGRIPTLWLRLEGLKGPMVPKMTLKSHCVYNTHMATLGLFE